MCSSRSSAWRCAASARSSIALLGFILIGPVQPRVRRGDRSRGTNTRISRAWTASRSVASRRCCRRGARFRGVRCVARSRSASRRCCSSSCSGSTTNALGLVSTGLYITVLEAGTALVLLAIAGGVGERSARARAFAALGFVGQSQLRDLPHAHVRRVLDGRGVQGDERAISRSSASGTSARWSRASRSATSSRAVSRSRRTARFARDGC